MLFAETSWPEAVVATAGALGVFTLIAVIVWQVFSTGRTAMSVKRENAYKTLVEESVGVQERTAEQLAALASEVKELRVHASELDRMLKEVA